MRHGIPKPITYRGVRYPSHQALAKAYGISYGMAQARLKRGQPLDMPYCGGSPKGREKGHHRRRHLPDADGCGKGTRYERRRAMETPAQRAGSPRAAQACAKALHAGRQEISRH